jgi:hypothetical protein
MSKKDPTPAQLAARKALSERLKARHAAARAAKQDVATPVVADPVAEPSQTQEQPAIASVPVETVADNNSTDDLLRRVLELQAQLLESGVLHKQAETTVGPQLQNGKLTGTVERYTLDKDHYASPVDRLTAETKLQRFAFPFNYELEFDISQTSYTTIDNIRQVEPKFTLKLIRKIVDEMTGDDTGRRYNLTSMVFFEDPEAAIEVANRHGLTIDEANEAAFLEEMRYLRMRDWLFDIFYPKPAESRQLKEDVVDNRVVSIYEASDPNGDVKIPFDQMTRYKV